MGLDSSLWDMVNPACAGMILLPSRRSEACSGKPRVCGDDPPFMEGTTSMKT